MGEGRRCGVRWRVKFCGRSGKERVERGGKGLGLVGKNGVRLRYTSEKRASHSSGFSIEI
jgi:hypothetical protein